MSDFNIHHKTDTVEASIFWKRSTKADIEKTTPHATAADLKACNGLSRRLLPSRSLFQHRSLHLRRSSPHRPSHPRRLHHCSALPSRRRYHRRSNLNSRARCNLTSRLGARPHPQSTRPARPLTSTTSQP